MSSFKDLIYSGDAILVNFFKEGYEPCKRLSPELLKMSSILKEKTKIVKVDVDKNPGTTEYYQIDAVPTLILFKDGEIVWRKTGFITSDVLIDQINSVIPI